MCDFLPNQLELQLVIDNEVFEAPEITNIVTHAKAVVIYNSVLLTQSGQDSLPPIPRFFPLNVCALWAQTYQLQCMDNRIFLIMISYCFYMSTQDKWLCLPASPPPLFFVSLGPLGPNLKFMDQLEEKVLRNLNFPKHQITLTLFLIHQPTHPPMLGTIRH